MQKIGRSKIKKELMWSRDKNELRRGKSKSRARIRCEKSKEEKQKEEEVMRRRNNRKGRSRREVLAEE
jgi:hypothetical protein